MTSGVTQGYHHPCFHFGEVVYFSCMKIWSVSLGVTQNRSFQASIVETAAFLVRWEEEDSRVWDSRVELLDGTMGSLGRRFS